ncbi:MAG: SpoVA/SpoVAEb family sporulation membrane protein [Lachnospiraceae bacterium]|nr:SpoVA/SpoVAEb family sporulation membrane protein [Lachnospiraceae bacterium]
MNPQEYQEYIQRVTPTHSVTRDCIRAFFTGGAICLLGQALNNCFAGLGADRDTAAAFMQLCLIALSILLTGFNIFPKIARFDGAGALVPITGFANSVAAPAIEFQKEGQVFGIGCKIFTIAGPVILYGLFSSWVLGLIYWVLKLAEIV